MSRKDQLNGMVISLCFFIPCALYWYSSNWNEAASGPTQARSYAEELVFAHPRDEEKWSRHLSSGARLEIRIGDSESAPAGDDAAHASITVESLGSLDADLVGALRVQSMRMREEYRKRIEELAPLSAAGDAKAFAELSNSYAYKLRSMAEIELLDNQSYCVLPASAGGVPEAISSASEGSFGYRQDSGDGRFLVKDGMRVILVFPFSKSRFPIYSELKSSARSIHLASAIELAREFNALPESRRFLFRQLLDAPGLLANSMKEHATFYERYQLASLSFDRETATMMTK